MSFWFSNMAALAVALAVTTPLETADIAPKTTDHEQSAGNRGLSWSDRGDIVGAPAFAPPARLWKVDDHDESDMPTVAFVPPPESGQLILVRHADRDPAETVLNATGRARALALPAALADLALDAIFIADFQRNSDTAAPLAAARGLVPERRDPDSALAGALAQASDGRSAIWIGNVGNLAHLWDAYDLPGAPPLDYGEIAVLTAKDGTWQVSRRSFAP